MELIVALTALAIALGQLCLQRNEIRVNSQVTALTHMAALLAEKISHHEKIIADQKAKEQTWKRNAERVNKELRPMLGQVNARLFKLTESYLPGLNPDELRHALRLEDE